MPQEVRAYIEELIAADRLTFSEMLEELKRRFPVEAERGDLPSASTIRRYGRRLDERLKAVRASTEAARLIGTFAADTPDARSEALIALAQHMLLKALLNIQEVDAPGVDAAERLRLATALSSDIAALSRASVRLKKFQAEVDAKVRRQLRREHRAAFKDMSKGGQISLDTMTAIKMVLGLA